MDTWGGVDTWGGGGGGYIEKSSHAPADEYSFRESKTSASNPPETQQFLRSNVQTIMQEELINNGRLKKKELKTNIKNNF